MARSEAKKKKTQIDRLENDLQNNKAGLEAIEKRDIPQIDFQIVDMKAKIEMTQIKLDEGIEPITPYFTYEKSKRWMEFVKKGLLEQQEEANKVLESFNAKKLRLLENKQMRKNNIEQIEREIKKVKPDYIN